MGLRCLSLGCPILATAGTFKSQLWDRGTQLHRLSITYQDIYTWRYEETAIGFHESYTRQTTASQRMPRVGPDLSLLHVIMNKPPNNQTYRLAPCMTTT